METVERVVSIPTRGGLDNFCYALGWSRNMASFVSHIEHWM
jgi:hypothetical protein